MTDTETALLDCKREIESAVTAAAQRLRERTGLVATVKIETIDTSTVEAQARLYVVSLLFSA
jgi:hypothetical protein